MRHCVVAAAVAPAGDSGGPSLLCCVNQYVLFAAAQ